MSLRRTIGNIVIFFAVLGLIINFGIIIVGVLLFSADILNLEDIDPLAIIGLPIRIVFGFIGLGIGILIRGRNEPSFR